MRSIARRLGYHGSVERIHRSINGVFRVESGPVIRIACTDPKLNHHVSHLADFFEAHELPAIRLHPQYRTPVEIFDTNATIWTDAGRQQKDSRADAKIIGKLLKIFHSMKVPNHIEIPKWDPLTDWEKRISNNQGLTESERCTLKRLIQLLKIEGQTINIQNTHLIHGDPEPSNLIWNGNEWIWCDFDTCRLGPIEADLAASWAGEFCFGRKDEWAKTLDGYGLSQSPQGPLWEYCQKIKLLSHVIGGLGHSTTKGNARSEFVRRLTDVAQLIENPTTNTKPQWTPFSKMTALDLENGISINALSNAQS